MFGLYESITLTGRHQIFVKVYPLILWSVRPLASVDWWHEDGASHVIITVAACSCHDKWHRPSHVLNVCTESASSILWFWVSAFTEIPDISLILTANCIVCPRWRTLAAVWVSRCLVCEGRHSSPWWRRTAACCCRSRHRSLRDHRYLTGTYYWLLCWWRRWRI